MTWKLWGASAESESGFFSAEKVKNFTGVNLSTG